MNSADTYRQKAVELEALMRAEKDPAARIQWEKMGKAYRGSLSLPIATLARIWCCRPKRATAGRSAYDLLVH